jgi:hypothetical protein
MILLPLGGSGKGLLMFAASRTAIGWRAKDGAWMLFKPPWSRQLYSERLRRAKTLFSVCGFRLLRVSQ